MGTATATVAEATATTAAASTNATATARQASRLGIRPRIPTTISTSSASLCAGHHRRAAQTRCTTASAEKHATRQNCCDRRDSHTALMLARGDWFRFSGHSKSAESRTVGWRLGPAARRRAVHPRRGCLGSSFGRCVCSGLRPGSIAMLARELSALPSFERKACALDELGKMVDENRPNPID